MKKEPLVSILITYFYKMKYIKKTLNSIINQNYNNYEIIFVYDNGNLSEFEEVKKLLENFRKKKIIINKKNIGASKSRNKGLKHCNGSYIALIDADDIWSKNKLFFQISYMVKKKSLFSFTSYGVIDDTGNLKKYRKVSFNPNYNSLQKTNIIGLSTVIVSRKLIKLIKFPNLKTQEDLTLWLNLLKNGVELEHIKKTLTFWRSTRNSLSSYKIQKLKDAFTMFYKYENKNLLNAIYCVLVLTFNKISKNL
tara:strand:- start:116 stop:868 length:753 start_codon:yes stop_codon:yes gene_type:complete